MRAAQTGLSAGSLSSACSAATRVSAASKLFAGPSVMFAWGVAWGAVWAPMWLLGWFMVLSGIGEIGASIGRCVVCLLASIAQAQFGKKPFGPIH